MPRLSQVSRKCKVKSVKSKNIIACLLLLFIIISSLFTLTLTSPSPSFAATPDPKPCFNPIPTDNLTDNYITDDTDEGDPPGPQGKDNIEALKFTFVTSGAVGTVPDLRKTMTFTADFSKLQAIFGAPTSDYIEGRAQSTEHAQANLLDLKNPRLIQKHQGPIGKTNPTAVTDNLRKKYVNYVNDTPTLAESKQEFSDYNGQNKKTINQLVQDYKTPTPPSPNDDRTPWINTWGKYWENIPTTYNEFYIGKLEFRPVHGTTAIKALKDGTPGACFPNTALRIVEFPVPNFFRSAATSGVMNLAMLPKSAWSDQNDLMGIQGAVAGIKTSASDFIKNCFKFATNNPLTNMVKKVIKVSMQKLDQQYSVYAAVGASGLSTSNQTCDTSTGLVSVKFNWTPQPDGAFFVKEVQWLDLSLTNDDFASSFVNTSSPPSKSASTYTTGQAGGQIGPLDPGKTHYWRINTRNSLNGVWSPSPTNSFNTISCAAPSLGATLSPMSSEACIGDQVNITFNWTPQPNGAFFTTGEQWLDLSTNAADPFGPGNYINQNVLGRNSYSTTSGGSIGPLLASTTHYWRINTLNSLNGTWYPSATGTFTTKNCVVVAGATLLPTSNEDCTASLQVNITFNWMPQVNNVWWVTDAQWLDLSTNAADPFGPGNYINHDVGGLSSYSTTTAPGNIGPLLPSTTHYWRINTRNALNGAWAPSDTGTFTTKNCKYTINPPIITRLGINKIVTFTFSPPSDGTIGLFVYPTAGGTDVFKSGFIPSGQTQVTWPNSRWGDYRVVILNTWLGKASSEPDVTFHVPYTLDKPTAPGRSVVFTWAPPIHLDPASGNAMAIIVRKTDVTHALAWDSGGLPLNSSTITWQKASPGDYEACLLYNGLVELDSHAENCKTFSVSFGYNWTVFDLSDKSCIKVGKEGKAGNAPFCAIYADKFDAANNTVANEIEPAKNIKLADRCNAGTSTIFKLNTDSDNVVCTFQFEWKSTDYTGKTDKNGKSISLEIPSTGNGNWDECDPEIGGFRTCYLTVGVWPDFRVPYLGQIWNNSLYSDTNEYLPTKQVTGQPGVYSLLQPKVLADYTKQDPQATFLQGLVDKCKADPPILSDPGKLRGCGDLANWATTGGNANQYPGLETCVLQYMITNQPAMTTCLSLVTISIIDSLKKLPGEVSGGGGVAGINTGGGSVLGTNAGNQKERLIGAVDCGKHFSRDIALKPKVLQQSLGIQQDCNLTASVLSPGSTPPPVGSPLPTSSPLPPSGNYCPLTYDPPNGYTLDNPLGLNFGDPNCNFSQSKLYDELRTIDPTYTDYWFFTIAPCESGYNPNSYNPVSTSGSAWGLFQMGHQAYPALGIDVQMNNEFDRGDVIWQTQTSNAVSYNKLLGNSFAYWGCAL